VLAVFHNPYELVCLIGPGALVLYCSILAFRSYKKTRRFPWLDVLDVVASIAILVTFLVPSRARIPREYFEGKDQFEWAEILESSKGPTREKAIEALCELLKRAPQKTSVREVALHALVGAQAKEAIPFLTELLKSADEYFRYKIERAIEEISQAPM
jgi:hypothetical protein